MFGQPKGSRQTAAQFSARFNSALDAIHAPPKNKGRLNWVTAEYNRLDPKDPVRSESVRRWLTGSLPKHSRLPVLARLCRVRTEWLISGQGPREPEPDDAAAPALPESLLSEAEQDLLDAYRALDARDRQRVHRLIAALRDDSGNAGR